MRVVIVLAGILLVLLMIGEAVAGEQPSPQREPEPDLLEEIEAYLATTRRPA